MKDTRVIRARDVIGLVQNFVRERRLSWTGMAVRDVMNFLGECGIISLDRTKPKSLDWMLRYVAHYLCRNSYIRGKKKGGMYHRLKEENVVKNDF